MQEFSGSYTKSYKENNFIYKELNLYGITEKKIFKSLCHTDPIESIYTYYYELLNIDFKVAKIHDIYYNNDGNLIIKQEWIEGITLEKYLDDNSKLYFINRDITQVTEIFKKIIHNNIYLYSCNKDIRIDWNLRNFIIYENDLVIVDVVPPIYVSKLPKNNDFYMSILINLYVSTVTQIISILSYCVKPYITNSEFLLESDRKLLLKTLYDELEKIILESCVDNKFELNSELELLRLVDTKIDKNKIYNLKIRALHKYLTNCINYNQMVEEFNSYSLRYLLDKNEINTKKH